MWISLIGIVFFSIVILYQDFKERLLNLWVVIGFIVCSFIFYLTQNGIYQFLENIIFCVGYFLLCYIILALYFYIKNRKFEKLLDTKIGWGDILVLFAMGATMPFPEMIYLFTVSFIISALVGFLIRKKNPSIPLAGISVVLYSLYILIEKTTNCFN